MSRRAVVLCLLAPSLLLAACAAEPPPRSAPPPSGTSGGQAGEPAATTPVHTLPPNTATPAPLPPPAATEAKPTPGAPTAAPPSLPPPGAVAEQRNRTAEVRTAITNGVAAYHPLMRKCYDDATRTHGDLAGRVTVKFTVAPSGDVVLLENAGSTLHDDNVVKCVIDVFARMKFQPFEGQAQTIVYPVEFSQAR